MELLSKQNLLQSARELLVDIEKRFILMGRLLLEIHQTQAWDVSYESFDNPGKHNFVEDIGLNKPHANKLMNIAIKFGGIPETKLLQAGQGKLFEVLPYVGRDSAENLVDLAIAYPTQKELRKGLQNEFGTPKPLCLHEKTHLLLGCDDCSDMWLTDIRDPRTREYLDRVARSAGYTRNNPGNNTGEN